MTKTVFDLPREEAHQNSGIPKDGDAVLVIRPDGSVGFMTVGMDSDTIAAKVAADIELTDEEQSNLDVASKAFALLVAAQSPMIMAILEDIVDNKDIIDFDRLAAYAQAH